MFYILCTLTKSEMTITELVDFSENCSRKGGVSDESDKSVISKKILYSSSRTLTSCLLVKKTCLHVFLSKNMPSCQDNMLHSLSERGCGATARHHSLPDLSCLLNIVTSFILSIQK